MPSPRFWFCAWLAMHAITRSVQAQDIQAEAIQADRVDFFERKIRPVLVEHCYACHSLESGKSNGGLRVDTRDALRRGGETGAAVVEQDAAKSLLIQAIQYDSLEMPPKGRLSESTIADFVKWIEQGAADPRLESELGKREEFKSAIDYEAGRKHWAFHPPRSYAELPNVDGSWSQNRIDIWISDRLQQVGLQPSAPAAKHVLLRRVTLDLLGLPPAPEEVERFLTDKEPDAYERAVDRILQSPHYGERWARPWMDLSRYAEDQAHIVGEDRSLCFPNAYLYRDWLVRAFNSDVPYDRFIQLQLAADLMHPDDLEQLPALGFMGLGPKYYRRNAPEVMADEWEDKVDVLTRGLLGITIACARCHDHKFDPIGTEDYYALAGVFASSEMFNRPMQADVELGKDGNAKSPAHALHILREGKPTDLSVMIRGDVTRRGPVVPRRFVKVLSVEEPPRFEQGSGRWDLAKSITDGSNPLVARVMVNRIWQQLMGRGLVETPSNFGTMGQLPSHPQLLDDLATRFMESGWSIKWLQREIVLSATYRQSSHENEDCHHKDPHNLLYGRMQRKRLPIEAWRDSILAVADQLDHQVFGNSIDPSDPAAHRRTLYSEVSRLSVNRMLAIFDFPDPNVHSDGRTKSVNPLQKLFVLNSPFMLSQADSLKARLENIATHPADRIRAAYLLLYGRKPSDLELIESLDFLAADHHRWSQWAQVMLAANELAVVD